MQVKDIIVNTQPKASAINLVNLKLRYSSKASGSGQVNFPT